MPTSPITRIILRPWPPGTMSPCATIAFGSRSGLRFGDPLLDAETFRAENGRLVEIGARPLSLEQVQGAVYGADQGYILRLEFPGPPRPAARSGT